MACDETLAATLRADLADAGDVDERPMSGMIALGPTDAVDPARRAPLPALALDNVRSLPPK